MLGLITMLFVIALVAPALVSWIGRNGFFVLALAPAVAAVRLALYAPGLGSGAIEQSYDWAPALGLSLSFRLDALALVLALIVTVIGALVLAYCGRYFGRGEHDLPRFAGVLVAFAAAMLGLVTTDDVMVLYTFWELTSVLSYLLIGHYTEKKSSRRAAMNALTVTTAGGLAMMIGLLSLAHEAGTYHLSGILAADIWDRPAVVVATFLVTVGAITKSALFPTHFWLPGAMAAPTPVSAYLHAAAMVKAGIYLILRIAPAAHAVPGWTTTLVLFGGVTMLLGAYRALRQVDIKLLLAYSTVSQLGFMTMIAAVGTDAATLAALVLLVAHAIFKAALFMVVGVVDKATGTRDMRQLSGLGRKMPVVAATGWIAAASMAAVPPLFGFVAKETVYAAVVDQALAGHVASLVVLTVSVAGSMMTVAYSWRFAAGAFLAKSGSEPTSQNGAAPLFWGPPALLALASIVLAWATGPLEHGLGPIAHQLPGPEAHLHLYDGWTPALAASLVTLAGGALIAWKLPRINAVQAQISPSARVDAERAYRSIMRGVDRVARVVTARTQRGSLPFVVGTIFVAVIAVVGGMWLFQPLPDLRVTLSGGAIDVLLLVVIASAAIAATRARHRLRAVLLVSITGYALALAFLLAGAPDVALTQFLVETVTLIIFVLVLRRMPLHFSRRPFQGDQLGRWTIAIGTAIVLCVGTVLAANARSDVPLGRSLIDAAYELGGGHNAVNVVLVDARVWDTMGEISVLVVIAAGVASLVFIDHHEPTVTRLADADTTTGAISWGRVVSQLPKNVVDFDRMEDTEDSRWSPWLVAGRTIAPERRMVILEVVARILFPALMALAVYFLFAGHNQPGGGFAAGLVAGLALAVRYVAGGRFELTEAMPIQAGLLIGTGLALATLSGLAPLAAGAPIFTSALVEFDMPVYGHVKIASPLVFDTGVMLVVLGLVLDVLRALGVQLDRLIESEAESANLAAEQEEPVA